MKVEVHEEGAQPYRGAPVEWLTLTRVVHTLVHEERGGGGGGQPSSELRYNGYRP